MKHIDGGCALTLSGWCVHAFPGEVPIKGIYDVIQGHTRTPPPPPKKKKKKKKKNIYI